MGVPGWRGKGGKLLTTSIASTILTNMDEQYTHKEVPRSLNQKVEKEVLNGH